MLAFTIRGPDIAVLLEALSEKYSTAMRKIWHCQNQIHAVFVRDELALRTMSEQAIVVILEHEVTVNVCRIQCMALGGGSGLLRITWGSHEAAESTFRKLLEKLSMDYGWQCEQIPIGFRYTGVKCPSCGAVYAYPPDKVQRDGSVRCQNCGRPFFPGQEEDS